MIEFLAERNSHAALVEPAPTPEQLQQILMAATRAPDHGWLRPTRFITVQGNEREALNGAFKAHAKNDGCATDAQINKAGSMANRAPLILIAICRTVESAKVPQWEQVATTSVALSYSQLAAESLGFGTIWRTGAMAESKVIRQFLQLGEDEAIVGFLYVGSMNGEPKKRPECANLLPIQSLSELLSN